MQPIKKIGDSRTHGEILINRQSENVYTLTYSQDGNDTISYYAFSIFKFLFFNPMDITEINGSDEQKILNKIKDKINSESSKYAVDSTKSGGGKKTKRSLKRRHKTLKKRK